MRAAACSITTIIPLLGCAFGLAACDSPVTNPPAAPSHRPWAPRICVTSSPTFEPANGSAVAKLDLCALDPAQVEGRAEIPGLAEARARAQTRVAGLSQADKLRLVQGGSGAFVGNVPAVAGLPAIGLQDGPAGVARFNDV